MVQSIHRTIKRVSSADDAVSKPARYVGIDTETAPFTDSCVAPPLAVLTVYDPRDSEPRIYSRQDAPWIMLDLMRRCLADRTTIVGHHLPFDISIIMNEAPELTPLIFRMLDEGLFECTLLCEKLNDIARGQYDQDSKVRWHDLDGLGRKPYTYGLAPSMRIRLGITVAKDEESTGRGQFGPYVGLSVDTLPAFMREYALQDARYAWQLREKQEDDERADAAGIGEYVYANAPAQTRAGFALQLARVKGIRTDPVHTKRLKETLEARMLLNVEELIRIKFLRPGYVRPRARDWQPPSMATKAVKDRIRQVAAALNIQPKLTKTGDLSRDAEALEMLDDDQLNKLREYTATQKLIGYTKILESGFVHAIHSEPNTLIANGRISWGSDSPDGAGDDARSVNLTNLPTEPGVRECYIPRVGNVFYAVDYSTLELCTVAQCCLWLLKASKLAEYLNNGTDLHSLLGSMILGISYEEFRARRKQYEAGDYSQKIIELVRDLAKRANFGLWGGMGVDRFLSTCRDLVSELRKVGIELTRNFVANLKTTWSDMLPESKDYFKIANSVAKGDQLVSQFVSKRLRGGLEYTDCANTFFSGLAADGAKEALYKITRAFYAEPDSPLFNRGWITAFIHDEFFGEAQEQYAHEVAHEVERIARETMQEYTPDIRIKCSLAIMRRWRKGAKPFYDESKRLRPYEDSPAFARLLAQGEVFA